MTIADDFAAEVSKLPILTMMIDRIEPQSYGCSYLWDGYMTCHIVWRRGWYVAVDDHPIDRAELLAADGIWTRSTSIFSLCHSMAESLQG